MIYNCEACAATFDHDDSIECGVTGVENMCEQLIGAGWAPARLEVRFARHRDGGYTARGDLKLGEIVCIRWGWLCPKHERD